MRGRLKQPDVNVRPALPIIGKVKCGMRPEGGLPKSVDYFIPSGKYEALFKEAYGDKPSTIQIIFISNEVNDVCNQRYEYRDKKGDLFASGDGEEFLIWNEKRKQYDKRMITEVPDIMDKVKGLSESNKGWEVILTLRFLIPKINKVAGLWEFTTKGNLSSIPTIVNTFDTLLEHKGSVIGVIFDLSVKFAKSQKPGVTSRYPVITLVPNMSESNMEMLKGSFVNPDQHLLK